VEPRREEEYLRAIDEAPNQEKYEPRDEIEREAQSAEQAWRAAPARERHLPNPLWALLWVAGGALLGAIALGVIAAVDDANHARQVGGISDPGLAALGGIIVGLPLGAFIGGVLFLLFFLWRLSPRSAKGPGGKPNA
jgi:hypothetical protein